DIAANTLVVFMSDNGANKTGQNSPFSGFKGNVFEGGIRVPCVVKWPGVLARGEVSDQPCMTMDFSMSIVRAAGTRPPAERPFDGIDILKTVETGAPLQKRTLFWRIRRGQATRKAVRDGSLKYIWLADGDDVKEFLFDIERDPAEKKDLLNTRKDDVRRLKALLENWEIEVKHKR
ncbi:MAG TPA: sulfatase-like hydrolase/transferase, partial [Sedimentisphaerales bacterium]|nr:sulfatase-like hydrolase/transferase [Sedimentisphaerales bacterium]